LKERFNGIKGECEKGKRREEIERVRKQETAETERGRN
jgi:hypothetical protein